MTSEEMKYLLERPFDAIVIGSGFGGAVAVTKLAKTWNKEEKRILVLERGTWWKNPEGPGLRSYNAAKSEIRGDWQYWARPRDSQGLVYLANSLYKEHNPLWDLLNPTIKDNDLGPRENRKGLYRFTRFSHRYGNVDVVSGSAVGGGSLFYSGVNLIPHQPVLHRIGLGHLTGPDFRSAGEWMQDQRGTINKINTKSPVPHYRPSETQISNEPEKYLQLATVPESGEAVDTSITYEQPAPAWTDEKGRTRVDADYLLLDRARVLKRSLERVLAKGGFSGGKVYDADGKGNAFDALPLSVVEYEPPRLDQKGDALPEGEQTDSTRKNTYCTREGACILGCLPSARHTLYKTIQRRQQKTQGVQIEVLPLSKVSHISRVKDGGYEVCFESFLGEHDGDRFCARSSQIFVAAGCLGTTEIMLRSKALHDKEGADHGLPLSGEVGNGFSTNGDFFGFSYDLKRDYKTRKKVDEKEVGNATPKQSPRLGNANPTVGPLNSSHFYVSYGSPDQRVDVNVEDGGVPETFARLLHGLLPHFSDLRKFLFLGKGLVKGLLSRDPFSTHGAPDTEARDQDSYLTERELLSDVFFFNLMGAGPDEPLGKLRIQRDGAGLDLSYEKDKPLSSWEVFKRQIAVMQTLTEAMAEDDGDDSRKPELMLSPFWEDEGRVTVVHPLGGCRIGSNVTEGVVDDLGRVFDASAKDGSVLEGLYVLDASVIPGALGVNPTFTIVTHAVRTMDHVIASYESP